MPRLVSDTSPLNYLLQLDLVWILPSLFTSIFIPQTVLQELQHPRAPLPVKLWVENLPAWVRVSLDPKRIVQSFAIDPGESAAIALALQSQQDSLLLIDDRLGARVAAQFGTATMGTLGLLELAATQGLISLPSALGLLDQTNFRCDRALIQSLLARFPH